MSTLFHLLLLAVVMCAWTVLVVLVALVTIAAADHIAGRWLGIDLLDRGTQRKAR